MRKSEIASQWAHGGKPWSIHNMMSIKTLPFGSQKPCLSGQGRNNLRVQLSLSVDSLEKPGRQEAPLKTESMKTGLCTLSPCFPHIQSDHRECLHFCTSRVCSTSSLAALKGLLLPTLPRVWLCSMTFFVVPALQQVSWIEAQMRVLQKGLAIW